MKWFSRKQHQYIFRKLLDTVDDGLPEETSVRDQKYSRVIEDIFFLFFNVKPVSECFKILFYYLKSELIASLDV